MLVQRGTLTREAFEHYLLREVTVRQLDQFIKTLAATKSYSMAKQARTVLSLAFGLAVRYDAIPKNPVRDTTRLHKPPPDGQLEHIIEVMLGTSARIGEVLAIRKCDVAASRAPQTVQRPTDDSPRKSSSS